MRIYIIASSTPSGNDGQCWHVDTWEGETAFSGFILRLEIRSAIYKYKYLLCTPRANLSGERDVVFFLSVDM